MPEQAEPGARSAEGPSRDGEGGVEPEGIGSNTRWVWVDGGRYVVDLALWKRAWLAVMFRPELDPD